MVLINNVVSALFGFALVVVLVGMVSVTDVSDVTVPLASVVTAPIYDTFGLSPAFEYSPFLSDAYAFPPYDLLTFKAVLDPSEVSSLKANGYNKNYMRDIAYGGPNGYLYAVQYNQYDHGTTERDKTYQKSTLYEIDPDNPVASFQKYILPQGAVASINAIAFDPNTNDAYVVDLGDQSIKRYQYNEGSSTYDFVKNLVPSADTISLSSLDLTGYGSEAWDPAEILFSNINNQDSLYLTLMNATATNNPQRSYLYLKIDLPADQGSDLSTISTTLTASNVVYTIPTNPYLIPTTNPQNGVINLITPTFDGGIAEYNGKIYMTDKLNHLVVEYNPITDTLTNPAHIDLQDLKGGFKTAHRFPNILSIDQGTGVLLLGCQQGSNTASQDARELGQNDICQENMLKFDNQGVLIGIYPSPQDGLEGYAFNPVTETTYGAGLSGSDRPSLWVIQGIQSLSPPGGNSPPKRILLLNEGNGSGCDNCTPPTLGTDSRGIKMVSGGFTFNGITKDVEYFFTPYDLITVNIGADNLAEFKIYDDNGPDNIKHFEFAYGMTKGQSISDSKARIEYDIDLVTGNGTLILYDPENAIENDSVRIETSTVPCKPGATYDCLLVQVHHVFRAPLKFDIVGTNVWDKNNNAVQNYYNHGIHITGESLNPPKEITIIPDTTKNHPAKASIKLIQIDLTKDLWIDGWGYVWQGDQTQMKLLSDIPFARTTDAISGYSGYSDRTHSEFSNIVTEQQIIASQILHSMYGSSAGMADDDVNYAAGENNSHDSDQLRQMHQELADLKARSSALSSEYDAMILMESLYSYMSDDSDYVELKNSLNQVNEKIMVLDMLLS